MKNVCEAKYVSKSFDRLTVIKEASFTVAAKQFILLTGENGSGKTTLLRMLATLARPSRGRIEYFTNHEVSLLLREIRPKIGFLVSHSCLQGELSIVENLALIMSAMGRRPDYAMISSYLRFWNLERVATKACKYLSKGELQKGNIIRSLLHEPEFLLWDEPQNGLDAKSQGKLMEVFQDLRQKNCAVICTSHFPDALAKHFDSHWNLVQGVLQQ